MLWTSDDENDGLVKKCMEMTELKAEDQLEDQERHG